MKAIGCVIVSGTLLVLLGAAPTAPTQESSEEKAIRLQVEVDSLRQANASLEKRLTTTQAENLRLQAELARARSQSNLIVPRLFGNVPTIPENAVPKGQGDIRHYIIPVEFKLSEPTSRR